jgi:glutathione S-transferase
MLTIHHLGVSQSDRVVWLMEELGLPYKLVWYKRGADGLMPPEYVALHPAATAPVVTDGDKVLAESAAILEYICHRYAGDKLTVAPSQPNYYDYVYWMHFNNNVQGLFFAKLAAGSEGEERARKFIKRREDGYYHHLNARLGEWPYLAGPEFSCADIMVTFNLTELALFGGRGIDDLPNVRAYVERIGKRPAYAKAMKLAGPGAAPPA